MQTLSHLFLKIKASYANANCTNLANGCIQGHEVCNTFPKNWVPAYMYTPQNVYIYKCPYIQVCPNVNCELLGPWKVEL